METKINVTSDKRMTANSRKNTWWNLKRLDANMTFKDIEDVIGVSKETLCQNFSGKIMPTDGRIKILCNMFDVDFDEGKKHFQEACDTYKPEKRNPPKVKITTMSKKELAALKKAEAEEKEKSKDLREDPGLDIKPIDNTKTESEPESEPEEHYVPIEEGSKRTVELKKPRKKIRGYIRQASNKKLTWWEKKRMEEGLIYRDIASVVGVGRTTINANFIGKEMPSQELSNRICDLFNVDYEEGYNHFMEGFKSYLYPEERNHNVETDSTPVVEQEKLEPKPYNWYYGDKSSKNINILRKIYNLVDYDVFREVEKGLTDRNADDVLSILYGKITSYDVFLEIAKELRTDE